MISSLPTFELRDWTFLVFVGSAMFIHLRGRDRFELKRALDFTGLLASINTELAPLREHGQAIRDEAVGGINRFFHRACQARLK